MSRISSTDVEAIEAQAKLLIDRVDSRPSDPERVQVQKLQGILRMCSQIKDISQTLVRRAAGR